MLVEGRYMLFLFACKEMSTQVVTLKAEHASNSFT